jgi:hexosaminidase
MNSILRLIFCLSLISNIPGLFAQEKPSALIPYPRKVEWLKGKFLLTDSSTIICSSGQLQNYFVERIKTLTGLSIKSTPKNGVVSKIIFSLDSLASNDGKESYEISISTNILKIRASTEEGLFRGMQTIFQLIRPEDKTNKDKQNISIACCNISDSPAFIWRGLNIDCARHFMSKDFIKRYIDILAYFKFNTLHWHLTDDQGWRIEIKKYPLLTKVGAWRKEADGSIYGGYYSQEDIKEIVAYAQSRFITIVPEIEMPGHCLASLASYPENSCTGGPFEVGTTWGVIKDVYCAGNDSTFNFLENILDEVTALFPGNYIHIGGDEVPKFRWRECPKCQARIKTEHLKNEDELQSYFIKRISNYIYSKGKNVIGWDEILQGGLAPGAIVQSWQGYQGAIDATNQGHYTIYSPTSNTYLDTDPEDLDLQTAYFFNPIPAGLQPDEKIFVLGSEANLWTERAPQELVDEKLFPRLLALSEVFWSNPLIKNYDEFLSRVRNTYDDLTALGIQYGPESKAISYSTSYDEINKDFKVNITPGQKDLIIRYTVNGIEPDTSSAIYTAPIIINKTTDLKITAFRSNHPAGKKYSLSFDFHKALNAKITLVNNYSPKYTAGGDNGLIDGIRGTTNCHDGLWQGYDGVDFEGVIDLGEQKEISTVKPGFLLDANSWIFLPLNVEISLSKDGINYIDKKVIKNDIPEKDMDIILKDFTADFSPQTVRYIKVKAESIKKCPPWHTGAGQNAWLFIDEIEVE